MSEQSGTRPRPANAETELLRTTVRNFLVQCFDRAEAADEQDGYDRQVWRRMADELDLMGFSIPAEFGGANFSWGQQRVVFEELGRALAPLPYFASVAMASPVLMASGDTDAMSRYLPALAAGTSVGSLAVADDGETTVARQGPRGYVLNGAKLFVLDGQHTDMLCVTAQLDGLPSLFVVASHSPSVRIEPMRTLDVVRGAAQVTLTDADATLVGEAGAGSRYLETATSFMRSALAAEQVGGLQRCLDMTVEYARTRKQFGRPIGSFQAVKHKCVDMLLKVELAHSLVVDACDSSTRSAEAFALAAASACSYATDAYRWVAAETIQVHGGIGFTWEHEAHLHLRRAHANAALHTSPRRMRRRVVELLRANPQLIATPPARPP